MLCNANAEDLQSLKFTSAYSIQRQSEDSKEIPVSQFNFGHDTMISFRIHWSRRSDQIGKPPPDRPTPGSLTQLPADISDGTWTNATKIPENRIVPKPCHWHTDPAGFQPAILTYFIQWPCSNKHQSQWDLFRLTPFYFAEAKLARGIPEVRRRVWGLRFVWSLKGY
jgi:hypothetical protein